MITYSAPITNNAASDISITGSAGPLATIQPAPVLDRNMNAILFNIPAGGSPGQTISIEGVRLQVAGLNITQATATIFTSTNTVTSSSPVVINQVMQPLSFDDSCADPLSFSGGIVTNDTSSFVIAEQFPSAFKGMTGLGGQTVPTMIRLFSFLCCSQTERRSPLMQSRPPQQVQPSALFPDPSGTHTPFLTSSTEVDFIYVPRRTGSDDIGSFQMNVTLTQPPVRPGAIRFDSFDSICCLSRDQIIPRRIFLDMPNG